MPGVLSLCEVVLAVHDLEQATEFYRDVLGLEVMSPLELTGLRFLRAAPAAGAAQVPQMVVLVQLPPDAAPFSGPRTLHHLALEVPAAEFDAERARLERLGYSLRMGQHPVLSATRTMYVKDPEGNDVELICAVPR